MEWLRQENCLIHPPGQSELHYAQCRKDFKKFKPGCAKTYVRLSGIGRNLLQTTTFLSRKNTVIKENLLLGKIRLNIPFSFAIPWPFNLFLQAPFQVQGKTIYKDNNIVIQNIKCPIVFEFQVLSKILWTRTLGFQTTKCNIVLVQRTSG